jgi:hypothetical protein
MRKDVIARVSIDQILKFSDISQRASRFLFYIHPEDFEKLPNIQGISG